MESFRVDLPETLSEIQIIAVSDWHWSSPFSDHKLIEKDIAYINDRENVFCVLNGDLMDCAIKTSLSDSYGARQSPMEELDECSRLFEPLAKKGKILAVTPGNHELRHYKTNGIEPTRLMCQRLGIENRYTPTGGLLFIRFGQLRDNRNHKRKVLYTMYVTHGSGGGKKEGTKLQRLADLSLIVDADIYVCGHSHLEGSFKDGFARPNPANSSITYGKRLYVNTSAKLRYGGYGETGNFKVPCLDTPIITLSGYEKDMRATI